MKAHQLQLKELEITNAAHMATIDSMKRVQDENFAAMGEMRKGRETQDALAKQLQEQNTSYQLELDHLRAVKLELEQTVQRAVHSPSSIVSSLGLIGR